MVEITKFSLKDIIIKDKIKENNVYLEIKEEPSTKGIYISLKIFGTEKYLFKGEIWFRETCIGWWKAENTRKAIKELLNKIYEWSLISIKDYQISRQELKTEDNELNWIKGEEEPGTKMKLVDNNNWTFSLSIQSSGSKHATLVIESHSNTQLEKSSDNTSKLLLDVLTAIEEDRKQLRY